MHEQAGTYRIVLYENKELSFTFIDKNTVETISNSGDIITLENSDCNTIELGYSFDHNRSANNRLKYLNTITWKQLGLIDSNLELMSQLKESIYGWIALIEFYNTDQKIVSNPFKFRNATFDNNISNSYNIELKNSIFGNRILDYTPPLEFISTDIPGGNIADNVIPTGNEKITLN